MKLISWNVNGIRACVQKGFLDYFKEADADIFCIQETKMQEGQLSLELEGYHQYWNYAVRKGYSGTAVFTKKEGQAIFAHPVRQPVGTALGAGHETGSLQLPVGAAPLIAPGLGYFSLRKRHW